MSDRTVSMSANALRHVPLARAPVASPYLLSAFLVLLGGFLTLSTPHGPRTTDIRDVFGSLLAYQALLVLVLAYLHRARGEARDTLLLLGILATFLLDGLLFQHIYGWEPGIGRQAAFVGAASAIPLLLAVALALRLRPWSRLFGTVAAVIAFERLAPLVLVGATSDAPFVPRHVALGWLLAACLLPALVLPATDRGRSSLPVRAIERWGMAAALALAVVHFVVAGNGLGLPFRVGYFAPLLILLAPTLERLVPEIEGLPALRRLVGGLPYLGLALAATHFPPGMLDARWAQAWPLTPFTLALVLAAVVQFGRSASRRDADLLHSAALLASMAFLGGDLPEILSRARFPEPFQAAVVLATCSAVILATRRPVAGLLLQALPAFVVASLANLGGYPWTAAWLVMLAWGVVLVGMLATMTAPPAARLATAAVLTFLPVGLMLAQHDSTLRLAVAATQCALVLALGWWRRDGVLVRVAPTAAVMGLVGYPMSVQVYGEIAWGRLCMEIGFLVLLLGFLNSLYGDRLRGGVREWWVALRAAAADGRG